MATYQVFHGGWTSLPIPIASALPDLLQSTLSYKGPNFEIALFMDENATSIRLRSDGITQGAGSCAQRTVQNSGCTRSRRLIARYELAWVGLYSSPGCLCELGRVMCPLGFLYFLQPPSIHREVMSAWARWGIIPVVW